MLYYASNIKYSKFMKIINVLKSKNRFKKRIFQYTLLLSTATAIPLMCCKHDASKTQDDKDTRLNGPKCAEIHAIVENKTDGNVGIIDYIISFFQQIYSYIPINPLVIIRIFRLFVIFTPAVVASPLLFFESCRKLYFSLLITLIQHSGAIFIKWGQWAGTRPDIFTKRFCDLCKSLHENCSQYPFHKMRPIIEKELGRPIEDYFMEFDEEPLGNGCVAQVYKAKLKSGDEVAVKVLRPLVKDDYDIDILMAFKIASFMESMCPNSCYLQPYQAVKTFDQFLRTQLDLRIEYDNLITFSRNFQDDKHIKFPKPYFCTKSLLIESYEPGISMSDYLSYPKKDKIIAIKGTRAYLQMFLVDNFMHGDLHPGNILIRPDSGQIILIDAGLTVSLHKQQRINLFDLLVALCKFDGKRVGQLLIERRPEGSPEPFNADEFCLKMQELNDRSREGSKFVLTKLKMAEVLMELFNLCITHHITVDPNFTSFFSSIILLEGIGRQIDPDLDLFGSLGLYLVNSRDEYAGFAPIILEDLVKYRGE